MIGLQKNIQQFGLPQGVGALGVFVVSTGLLAGRRSQPPHPSVTRRGAANEPLLAEDGHSTSGGVFPPGNISGLSLALASGALSVHCLSINHNHIFACAPRIWAEFGTMPHAGHLVPVI